MGMRSAALWEVGRPAPGTTEISQDSMEGCDAAQKCGMFEFHELGRRKRRVVEDDPARIERRVEESE